MLDASTTISQNSAVDTLFQRQQVDLALCIPVGPRRRSRSSCSSLARARDRVQAIRASASSLAVAGALLIGFGAATPAFAAVAATNDPGRGDAVAAFIEVLTGRLVGAG